MKILVTGGADSSARTPSTPCWHAATRCASSTRWSRPSTTASRPTTCRRKPSSSAAASPTAKAFRRALERRRCRLPFRRLPGLPDRLLAFLPDEQRRHGAALRDHRQRAPADRQSRRRLVAGGLRRRQVPVRAARQPRIPASGRVSSSSTATGSRAAPTAASRWSRSGRTKASTAPHNSYGAFEARPGRHRDPAWAALRHSRASRCATPSSRGRGSRSATPTPARCARSPCAS